MAPPTMEPKPRSFGSSRAGCGCDGRRGGESGSRRSESVIEQKLLSVTLASNDEMVAPYRQGPHGPTRSMSTLPPRALPAHSAPPAPRVGDRHRRRRGLPALAPAERGESDCPGHSRRLAVHRAGPGAGGDVLARIEERRARERDETRPSAPGHGDGGRHRRTRAGALALAARGERHGISPADPFLLAVYPLTLAAFLSIPSGGRTTDNWKLALDAGMVISGVGVALWYFVLRDTAANGAAPLGVALALVYPLADLLILVAIVTLLLRHPTDGNHSALGWLAVSAAFGVADDLFRSLLLARGGSARHRLGGRAPPRREHRAHHLRRSCSFARRVPRTTGRASMPAQPRLARTSLHRGGSHLRAPLRRRDAPVGGAAQRARARRHRGVVPPRRASDPGAAAAGGGRRRADDARERGALPVARAAVVRSDLRARRARPDPVRQLVGDADHRLHPRVARRRRALGAQPP